MSTNMQFPDEDEQNDRYLLWSQAPSWMDNDKLKEREARVAEARERQRRRDEARREIMRWTALGTNGFPVRAIEIAKSADVADAVLVRVSAWDTSTDSLLVIAGGPGCGKTVAATWWAATRNPAPRFLRASTFAASSRYDRDTREQWFDAPGLVLDDLGAEFLDAKGSFLVDLDELIDVFYGNRKPLLITTNCTRDEFKSRYGERIADRIREAGSFWSCDEKSRRGKVKP